MHFENNNTFNLCYHILLIMYSSQQRGQILIPVQDAQDQIFIFQDEQMLVDFASQIEELVQKEDVDILQHSGWDEEGMDIDEQQVC